MQTRTKHKTKDKTMLNSTQITAYKNQARSLETGYEKSEAIREAFNPTSAQMKWLAKYDSREAEMDELLEAASTQQLESLVEWAASNDLMSLVMNLEELVR